MNSTLTTKLTAGAAAGGLTLGALLGLAGPANAATSGSTITTFAITGGALNITVPASTVALATGTVNTGAATASGQLGSVAVADPRGALVNTWSTTVSSTTFVTGGASTNETVPLANIAYSSGGATSTSGLGTFVPGVLPTMTTAGVGANWTGLAGNNTAAWNPTLAFTLSPSQVAGTYTGTVTHSVA